MKDFLYFFYCMQIFHKLYKECNVNVKICSCACSWHKPLKYSYNAKTLTSRNLDSDD